MLNSSDFSSISFTVSFENVTSRVSALTKEEVSLQELDKEGLILGLPVNSCALNQNVVIQIAREDKSDTQHPNLVFRATGKVESIEKTDETSMIRARIHLLQFDEPTWQKFHDLGEARQASVTRLLQSIKE